MRVLILVLFALTYQANGHNQHENPPQATPGHQNMHVTRKMEEYVHDMEYETASFHTIDFVLGFLDIFDMILKDKSINLKNR